MPMTIRAKITLFVLLVGLSEAVLLGIIGYNSVTTVARHAAELRRIGAAIEGARALSVALTGLSDPSQILALTDGRASGRFESDMNDLKHRVSTCAATACHGYDKRPSQMAEQILRELETIKSKGLTILSSVSPGEAIPWEIWRESIDSPARRLSRATEEMSETLMTKSKEIEGASREAEGAALLLVTLTTLFCIFIAVALCHPIACGIARPLENLSDQSCRIAEGDLTLRAAETGPRETVQLALSYNRMLDDLSRSRLELLKQQEHLEQEVEERLSDLRRKDEELKRSARLASVGLIAGTVAHDLNNPLTSLILNANLLQESIPREGKDRRLVDDLIHDAQRCRSIVMELRSFAREREMEKCSCNTGELIDKALAVMRFAFEARRITVGRDEADIRELCICDQDRMVQLLVNLISNAVDATPDGGRIRVGARRKESWLILEVEDYGPGVPPEHRERLFQKFFTTKKFGVGLGLTISKHIAEDHGGRIEYETYTTGEAGAAGRSPGTIMRVFLPLAEGATR